MQYVFITSAWIQLFIFQRNNGACWSLIASADKPNPFPFVGHRNTEADIIIIIIRSLICITDSLILLIEQGMQIWSQSGQETVSNKRCRFFPSSVDLKYFASHVETLLTVFAAEGLGLHRISMSLSSQSASGGYLMRLGARKYDTRWILFSEGTETWCRYARLLAQIQV